MTVQQLSFTERLFWWKVEKQRKICMNALTPEMAVHIAAPFDKPYFLNQWWDRMDKGQKKELLEHVWLSQESSALFGYDWWLPKFEELGFYSNCGIVKPKDSIVLYRGARPSYNRGMAWTPDIQGAKVFATRGKKEPQKKIYKMTVPPEYILAVFSGKVDSSHCTEMEAVTDIVEYILDYRYLNPEYIEEL